MSFAFTDEQVRWILYGAPTISVASRDAELQPSVGQGIGCHAAPGASCLRFYLLAPRNATVVADLRAGREVAVVLTRSSTTRSLQLKAARATEVRFTEADEARVKTYVETVVREWGYDGTPPAFTRALLATEPGPILAFEMTVTAAFDQTPGPRAGQALGAVPR